MDKWPSNIENIQTIYVSLRARTHISISQLLMGSETLRIRKYFNTIRYLKLLKILIVFEVSKMLADLEDLNIDRSRKLDQSRSLSEFHSHEIIGDSLESSDYHKYETSRSFDSCSKWFEFVAIYVILVSNPRHKIGVLIVYRGCACNQAVERILPTGFTSAT